MKNNIELSIGKNYVTNWGLWEAIREIIQNGQDSEKEGNPLSITYDEMSGTLSIINKGAYLDISSLVLGNSIKGSDEAIGKYGEGYKLALVVLLRLGKEVLITSGDETWKPIFQESKTFGTEVLAIEVEPNYNNEDKVMFEIKGITVTEYYALKGKSLRLAKETSYSNHIKEVECDYGRILLDDEYKGKFYVEGLFIQTDNNFKYGYDFNYNEVDLDRDRKAINYYDLCELTTKSLISQTEDFSIVETCIEHKTHDTKDLQYFFNQTSREFKEGYAQNYIEKHNLSKDVFLGTEKEVALVDKENKVITDEITAKWVNEGLGNKEEYDEIKLLAHDKNNKDVGMKLYNDSVLKKLHDWITTNYKRLSQKQIDNFLDICSKVQVSGISYVRDDIEKDIKAVTTKNNKSSN